MLYRHIHPEIISVRRLHEFIHLNDPEKIVHPPFSIDRKLFAVGFVYVRSRRRLTGTFHERERNGSRLGKGYNKNWERNQNDVNREEYLSKRKIIDNCKRN